MRVLQGTITLLKYLYTNHPPNVPDSKAAEKVLPDPLNSTNLKKILKKAITHYHPDRKWNKSPAEWRVFSEEIVKFLNRAWEKSFKNMD